MGIGKWLSLVVGVLLALLLAGLMLLLHPSLHADEYILVLMVLACLAVGLVGGLAHLLVLARFQAAARQLTAAVEAAARTEKPAALPNPGMGLNDLAGALNRYLAAQHQRQAQLGTHKRELEIQLRICDAERQHALAILNAMSDAVIVTDAFNEMALANEAAARILRFGLEASLHRPIDDVLSDSILVKLIKDAREGADPSLRRHVEHKVGSNGQAVVFDVALASVTQPGRTPPEPCGVVTILRDVTREKEIAEMKSDFVSSVSHELRTPLSSIKAYLEMLIDGEAHDEQTRAEFYGIIQSEATRLSRLIDNILNISRIESGVVKVQREHVSIPALIKEAIDVMQPQARAKEIALQEVPTPLFFQVFADKDMIYQATLNLISNAIKYTPNGGKVTISVDVDEHDRLVSVAVQDTGVGISPEAQTHLFQKFYRVAEHKKMAKGTGLGLNLVKQIVETVHGGKVSVKSEAGKGSTFTFSLPLADNAY